MAMLTDNARGLFDAPNLVWATTQRPDGSAHSTVVWADVDGDDVRFNTAQHRVKAKHLRSNPQVSLSVLDPEQGFHWASVSGTAEITPEGADAHIDSLAKKYLGVDEYPFRNAEETRVIVRVKITDVLDSNG